jgi:hypothetical protein
MIPFRRTVLLAALAAACNSQAAPAAPATPQTPADWSALAQRDLQAVADAIQAGHYGIHAAQPNVTEPLQAALPVARLEAAEVGSEVQYNRMLARFIRAFGDPHTGLQLTLPVRAWTGLLLDQVHGRYRVAWREADWPVPLPPVGAHVQQCDGVWIGTYLQSRVAPYIATAGEYPHAHSDMARAVMQEQGYGWTPAACTFELADGTRRSYALPQRRIGDEVAAGRLDAALGRLVASAKPVAVHRLDGNRYWVGMPDFGPSDGGKAYQAVYAQLKTLKQPQWVVFDLRGNGGGASSWGTRALEALYGKPFADRLDPRGGYAVYTVASQEVIDFQRRMAAHPNFAQSRNALLENADKLQHALAQGRKIVLTSGADGDAAAQEAGQTWPAPQGPRVAAVIDRGCFSSCMNFVQQLRGVRGAVVLGEATQGYSPYGEISQRELPSGRGWFQLPTAFFKTATATREPLVPDETYPGNMADDAALMRWVNARLTARR